MNDVQAVEVKAGTVGHWCVLLGHQDCLVGIGDAVEGHDNEDMEWNVKF